MTKILVIGSEGQLASELKFLQPKFSQFEMIFKGRNELDITKYDQLESAINDVNPEFIINCAAYTAVDKAETDHENSFLVNKIGIEKLGLIAREKSILIVHISTDFVFDGSNSTPYIETDRTNPISIYGLSKLKGEEALIQSGCQYIIIRTSWLYSSFGNNFVKTMIRLGGEKTTLNVVDDQIGTPTYCRDLADFIVNHLDQFKTCNNNIYHYSNEGVASWYDFAFEIMKITSKKCEINPIPSIKYPTAAKRPAYSVMNKSKVKEQFNIKLPHWKESLIKCIEELK